MPAEDVVKGGVLLLLLLVVCTKPSGASAAEGEGPPNAKAEATPAAQVRESKPTPATPEPAQATQPAGSAGAAAAQAAAGEGSEAQVLIWGGGRTPEDGRKALERFEAEREGLEAVLSPGEGYPRVVASDTLPGLKPGFHVVVLGACKSEEIKEPLATLQAFKPGVYSRAVKMVLEAGSCPRIENGLGESGTQRLKARPFELTAVSFMAIRPEKSAVPWLVRLYLRDEKGNLVDRRAVDPRDGIWEGTERDTCLAQTEVQGASLRITVECERAGGVPGPRVRREEFEYRISAGKIEWVSKPY